jgi:hypothetical protein
MEVGISLLSSGLAAAKKSSFTVVARVHAVTEAPPPFRLAGRATHQHARARRQRSGQAVSREGRQAKRNPGLARAREKRKSVICDDS